AGLVVSAGDDGKLAVSDAETGTLVVNAELGASIRAVGVSASGTVVRVLGSTGGERVEVDLSPSAIHRRACDLLGESSAGLTVADADPDALAPYRALPLCPPNR